VPYKRFAKPAILQLAQSYLQNENQSYRQTVKGSQTPLAYDGQAGEQGQQLSRSTVWKWLSWLGGLKQTLRRGASLVLEKDPHENPARDAPPISPKKFCLQARHDLLHLAARLLATAGRVKQLFGTELIFTR
jgi:hypothetical protein